MAVATSAATTAAIIGAAASTSAAGYSVYQGEQQKKKAKAELNSYERQGLENAFEEVGISTVGTDLMREEAQRTTANIVDALQGGGSRSLALLPAVQANTNQVNRQIQKDIDDQVIQREYAIAGEDSRIMGIKEQRDNQNIAALGSQYMAGEQNTWNGINGAIAAISYSTNTIADSLKEGNSGNRGSNSGLTISNRKIRRVSSPALAESYYDPLFNTRFQLSPIPPFTTEDYMYNQGITS